jgi:Ca2+-transporting ATPase
VFNEFNARSIGDKVNVFSGLHKNAIFPAVVVITIGLQILIVEVGGKFTSTTGLTIEHWGWSILMGFGSTPIGMLMRFIPVKDDPKTFANYYGVNSSKV